MTESHCGGGSLSAEGRALLGLGTQLLTSRYRFVTITPSSHARILAREPGRTARNVRDVLGWSLPFRREVLPPAWFELLENAGAVERLPSSGGEVLFRSRLRCSSLGEQGLFWHSAFPTSGVDAVFFGPDTYRFDAFLRSVNSAFTELGTGRVVDVGCGSGAGGILLALRHPELKLVLGDINPKALELAKVNAVLNGIDPERIEVRSSDVLHGVDSPLHGVIANPPFLIDAHGRAYRDGGGLRGMGLSLRILKEALERLEPGGRLALYTAAPIVAGEDAFRAEVEEQLRRYGNGAVFSYEELDPDIFGEELALDAYADVERLAAVGLCVRLGPCRVGTG